MKKNGFDCISLYRRARQKDETEKKTNFSNQCLSATTFSPLVQTYGIRSARLFFRDWRGSQEHSFTRHSTNSCAATVALEYYQELRGRHEIRKLTLQSFKCWKDSSVLFWENLKHSRIIIFRRIFSEFSCSRRIISREYSQLTPLIVSLPQYF